MHKHHAARLQAPTDVSQKIAAEVEIARVSCVWVYMCEHECECACDCDCHLSIYLGVCVLNTSGSKFSHANMSIMHYLF